MKIDFSIAIKRIQSILNEFIAAAPNIVLALLIFVLFFILARVVRSIVRRATERRVRIRTAGMAVGRLAQGVVIIIGILSALSAALPTFKPADAVGLLGLGSVAVGFAFRDIFQNFFAGLLLLLTQPFRIGDQITVGDFEGTVDDIQTRATFLKTYDGRRIVIPNSDLFTDVVIVNTAFALRRVEHDIGIGYGDQIDTARDLILEALKSVDDVLKEPAPDAVVVDLAPSTVNIRARWWVTPSIRRDVIESRDKVLTAIKSKLTENGIDLPFPTQQILFHDQTEQSDGDRTHQREGWPAGKSPVPGPKTVADSLLKMSLGKTNEKET
jgi:small conductance mechanosensitive channel